MKKRLGLFLGILGLVNVSHAALTDVGGGLVDDSTQSMTWLKDGNLMGTLCGDGVGSGDALFNSWQASANPPVDQTAVPICNTNNGRMTWNDAEAWIAHLNANNYLGFSDWRQPATVQPDASCDSLSNGQGFGYNCTAVGSELSHMFNVSLANPNNGDGSNCFTAGTINDLAPDHCFQNVGPFTNAYAYAYWSGTEYAPNTTGAWYFSANDGFQYGVSKVGFFYVWPVRSGNAVAAVPPQPVPTMTVWELGILAGLLVFIGYKRRKQLV